jgi:hypothetical protein
MQEGRKSKEGRTQKCGGNEREEKEEYNTKEIKTIEEKQEGTERKAKDGEGRAVGRKGR